jgi:hypothetical protein
MRKLLKIRSACHEFKLACTKVVCAVGAGTALVHGARRSQWQMPRAACCNKAMACLARQS